MPPFAPLHPHVHGPVPETAVGVDPFAQREDPEGADDSVWPWFTPHAPCIGGLAQLKAEQLTGGEPSDPTHVQRQLPLDNVALDGTPRAHIVRAEVGAVPYS